MYLILPYSFNKAKKLGVIIVPSDRKNKKIDVLDWYGNYITSIGDIRYLDYPYYSEIYGEQYAKNKRRRYKKRHENDSREEGSAGYYANKILW